MLFDFRRSRMVGPWTSSDFPLIFTCMENPATLRQLKEFQR
jgi:hypothetical protein